MKKKILALIGWLCLITLLLLLSAALFYTVNKNQWPWWYGAIGALLICAFAFTLVSLAKWIRRRRQKRLIKRMVTHDQPQLDTTEEQHKHRQTEVKSQFLAAIDTLKKSTLSAQGDPVHALPWFLVLGETDSGKTSALRKCGLTSLISKAGPKLNADSTDTCDWWFFEDAVVLDTAGRYTLPLNGDDDEYEWQEFLTLLGKHRKREPINGIVITLPAEMLVEGDAERIKKYGTYIANRLNALTTELKARVSVYLMITKADHIFGFNEFAEQLSADKQKEALGITIEQTLEASDFIDMALNDLCDRIGALSLLSPNQVSCAELSLTDELKALKTVLNQFARSAFGHGKYHEAVLLRGIYLSSARQQHPTKSACFSQISQSTGPEREHGLFLHDFFSHLLPSQRAAYHPSSAWLNVQRKKVYTLGGVFVAILTVGVLTLTYVFWQGHNQLSALQNSLVNLQQHAQQTTSPEQSLLRLSDLHTQITGFERELPPRYLQPVSLKEPMVIALANAKNIYSENFHRQVIHPTNQRQLQWLKHAGDPSVALGAVIDNFASQLKGVDATLNDTYRPITLSTPAGQAEDSETPWLYQGVYESLFNAYLGFNTQPKQLLALRAQLDDQLNNLLAINGELSWLVNWANHHNRPVSSNEFWQLPLVSPLKIPGAFTEQGHQHIQALLTTLSALKLVDNSQVSRFNSGYAVQYLEHWRNLNLNFNQTGEGMTMAERRMVSLTVNQPDNPFAILQQRTLKALQAIAAINDVSLRSLTLAETMLKGYWAEKEQDNLNKGQAFIDSAVNSLVEGDSAYFEKIEKGKEWVGAFTQAMVVQNQNIDNQSKVTESLGRWLSGADSGAGIEDAFTATQQLENLLALAPGSTSLGGYQLFNNIYQFMLESSMETAACRIQSAWESDVLGPLKYLPNREKVQRLYEKKGLLDTFLTQQLTPFVSLDGRGWKPKMLQGKQIEFQPAFFNLVERGAYVRGSQQQEYTVRVRSLPVTVNRDALTYPQKTTLSLSCESGEQTLVNHNYDKKQAFKWQPSSCLTTKISIDFGDFILNKAWEGEGAFPDFLQDMAGGSLRLAPYDFSSSLLSLKKHNIKQVTINYEIQGGRSIRNWKKARKLVVPKGITHCN
ncbi:hypothetical protein D515_01217 [Grimontia indica]|uniref:Type VI secretion system component TssM1 N-terminal domain-containing protein n=1 Tax=Grimontia indica TaxID=1056512 RepID=R1IWR3_9GAMM|nr:type VI secretion protein IcmF/TssM N-terminal domain-containing protein [Grimontia indica]EOD79745.1 hypothetical protein D515_01217 [Grimontia indica]